MPKDNVLSITLPVTKDLEENILKELKKQGFEVQFKDVNFVLGTNNVFCVEIGVEHEDLKEILERNIDTFDLSISTLEPLRKGGIRNLNDLLNYSVRGLKEILKLSQRSIDELKEILPSGYVLKFEE